MNWETFGHENVKKVLDLQINSGNLAHAYLFFGPQGVGKKKTALEFAQKILGSTLSAHPDFSILDEKEDITVETMRQFIEPLALKPFSSKKKVAVINNADLLNSQSGNALLKTLEEPSESTIIILISNGKNLLPTIVSRCLAFSFNSFSKKKLEEYARLNNIKVSEQALLYSFGSIARLIELNNPANLKEAELNYNSFKNLQNSALSERFLAIAKFAEYEPEDLKNIFTFWLLAQRQNIANAQAIKATQNLITALSELRTNKNKKLILQSLFVNL